MNLTNRIESYWNKRSPAFNKIRIQELHSCNADAWQNLILQQLPKKKNLYILDIGTGTGFFSLLFAQLGHKSIGIDSSEEMIIQAKKNACIYKSTATFFKMNAEVLSFENDVFDAVISRNLTWTLPHVEKAYTEWHRVLKNDGLLLNFDSDYGTTPFSKTESPACVHSSLDTALLTECSNIKNKLLVSSKTRPQWDIQLLKKIGFKDVDFCSDVSPLVHIDNNLQYENIPIFGLYAKK